MFVGCEIAAVLSKIQGRIRFTVFPIGIGELTDKMGRYRRLAHASRRFMETEREDRRS